MNKSSPLMNPFASSPRFNMATPLSSSSSPLAFLDRDAQAQRALLGESVYLEESESPSSPLNTPSPTLDVLSPLSVASHLQDACDTFQVRDVNPFLDASWKTRSLNEADRKLPAPHSVCQPPYSLSVPDEPVQLVAKKTSPKRQTWSVPVTPEPSAATLLPTIQEAAPVALPSPPPALPPRRPVKNTSMNAVHTYELPPTALSSTSSSPSPSGSSQMRRRPSPFPLGPLPPPPPPRRARYEPKPHIVDLATEQFKLKTPTISTATTTQLQQERERQWHAWESERIRSLEMTKEAAKNNRVQAPSRNTVVVQEKSIPAPAPAPVVAAPTKKSSKRRWWCFGGGAVESDAEEVHEKEVVRSASRLSTVSIESDEEEDEEEWDEARNSAGITGYVSISRNISKDFSYLPVSTSLLGFACASRKKAGASRPRATLKKRVQ
ncbi:hypothetical protein M408DRAFT_93687 [Serendipita vermifera MAFF 305830]|uniref:Uncharacterized protein n=1 Tax=Serendipita vermifera MAFF 305830 TaxID=933852 RepID=A0A0C2XZL6_SERVB|nr:hypothetical protein M408DRAFT_93687 [Serendipita vermifera MAFF 305830]